MIKSEMQLVLDDDYIKHVRSYFDATSRDADRKLNVLIECLNNACEDGVISGKTADVLKQFSDRASKLSGVILEYGKTCSKFAQEFFDTIDKIDEKLY